MKTKALIPMLILVCSVNLFAQGTVIFNNRVVNSLITHVYSEDPLLPYGERYGNSAIDTPSGTQAYTSELLTGSQWTAQLWAAPGFNQSESALTAVTTAQGGTSTFRTGGAAGEWSGTTATCSQVLEGSPGTFQVRVFQTSFGDWATAFAAFQSESGSRIGTSVLFNLTSGGINPTTGDPIQSPVLVGLTSFTLTTIPEPSTLVILGMGIAGLLLARRK